MTADVRSWLRRLDETHQAAAIGRLRVGEHYGIHLYAGTEPVGTTFKAADAAAIVAAHNAVPALVAALTAVLDLADELDGRAVDLRNQALDLRRHRFPDSARLRDEEAQDLTNLAARLRAAVAAPLAGHDNEEGGR